MYKENVCVDVYSKRLGYKVDRMFDVEIEVVPGDCFDYEYGAISGTHAEDDSVNVVNCWYEGRKVDPPEELTKWAEKNRLQLIEEYTDDNFPF